ncbi:high-affinity nicotinic acid transporter [Niveomyces insectorum RCEF 264]|uniref:High-affinity nicotinic acid transporter n=1 Tax=Niveomyces insectorum RCEF 264 TaxID=1081102 RepID=A0A162KAZ1_9HYPO|nr:high-affinity nicotinic acid transporter [Niveomyces insectorum RCEF 264]
MAVDNDTQDRANSVEKPDIPATVLEYGTALTAPTIDPARERRLLRKLDIFIAPIVVLMQLLSNLDRGNIGYAASQGMIKDLHLVGSQFNIAVSILFVTYITSEFPSALFVKWIGFHRMIPVCAIIWGTVCLCTGFCQSFGSLVAVRLLLGASEGCIFPSLSLLLLNWYKREELAVRITYVWGGAALSAAFGGLIAYGVLNMDGVAGYAGWRWLYIIEGLITVVFAFACFYLIPKNYETAYFLNEDDKKVMRIRAEQSEAYSGGDGHFKWVDLKLALTDAKVWVNALCQMSCTTITYGFGTFLPLIIEESFHYSVAEAQYLTIPVNLWGTFIYICVAILADKYSNRFLPMVCCAPLMMCGYAILLSSVSSNAKYGATYLISTGIYICAGINFAWLSANSAPDGKRAASVGMQQSITQLAGVVSGQIYRSSAAPKYTLGHSWSLGCACVAWCGWWVYRGILLSREKKKQAIRDSGAIETKVFSDRSADFRYVF